MKKGKILQQQKKPGFIIKKYRSILAAAAAVEGAVFLVSFTDSLVAGNLIGTEALAAVGLIAPFASIVTFIASVINSGVTAQYAYHIGRYEKEKAGGIFSQGLLLAVLSGIFILLLLLLFRESFIGSLNASEVTKQYAGDYYTVFAVYLCLNPLSVLLDNVVMADGGEWLSAAANITEIVGNVVLSIVFAGLWGIRGIALASAACKIAFLLIICAWIPGKKCNISFRPAFRPRECLSILGRGSVKASTFVFTGLAAIILNRYVLAHFGEASFTLLAVAERFLDMSSLFLGLSMALQPVIGTLRGEKDARALRAVLSEAVRVMAAAGAGTSLLAIIFAPYLARCFGLRDTALLAGGTQMLRVVGAGFIFQSLATLLFVSCFLLDKKRPALLVCFLKDLLMPVTLGLLLCALSRSLTGLWAGLAAAPAAALLLSVPAVRLTGTASLPSGVRKGCASPIANCFSCLLPPDPGGIYYYDLTITPENAAALSETVIKLLAEKRYPSRTGSLAGVLIEDLLMLILEKNPGKKEISAECALILDDPEVRIILRDNGAIFDLTDRNAGMDSLRQYAVSQMLALPEHKAYLTAMGYNRNEIRLGSRQRMIPM